MFQVGAQTSNFYISSANQIAAGVIPIGAGMTEINLIGGYTVVAGTWTVIAQPASITNARTTNTTAATGDEITISVNCAAGTYTVDLIYYGDGINGIMKIGTAANLWTSFDMYHAPSTWNLTAQQTGVTITESGLTTMRLYSDTKNGASSAYAMYPLKLTFTKTA